MSIGSGKKVGRNDSLRTSFRKKEKMNIVKPDSWQKVPGTYELAFYTALEVDSDVGQVWDRFLEAYSVHNVSQQKSEADIEKLGLHALVIYNSTPNQMARLSEAVEKIRSEIFRADELLDQRSFVPIYNFFLNEKQRFNEVLLNEVKVKRRSCYDNLEDKYLFNTSLFSRYVDIHAVTQVELNRVFNGKIYHLPQCIFLLTQLETLDLSNNQLRLLPADVGRLTNLKTLILSNNCLKNESLPYTVSFCTKLENLLLDNNCLEALPGYILKLKNLRRLYRHGNQNYFRTTFMWYGCESRERIRTCSFSDVEMASLTLKCAGEVQPLQFWSAKSIISSKCNYFLLNGLSEVSKNYISHVYQLFNICDACNTAKLLHQGGYYVISFKNPYLGNTCVPFQHWTCSNECAISIEVPARRQQIAEARQQQKAYSRHVKLHSLSNRGVGNLPRESDIIEEQNSPATELSPPVLCGPNRSRSNTLRSRCSIM